MNIKLKLSKDFLKPEVRDGYTVSAKMKKVWAVELDLLQELQRVCEKYNLAYFADSGTLLGTIRHQGFIPWDDDIDISMFRADYEKLCSVAEKEFKQPYFFQTEYTDKGSLRGHAQLRNSDTTGILTHEFGRTTINHGIFIDIFPLDAIPDSSKKFQILCKTIQKQKKKVWNIFNYSENYDAVKRNNNLYKRYILSPLRRWFYKTKNYDDAYKKYELLLQTYDTNSTTYIAQLFFCVNNNKAKYIYNKKDFASVIYMKFENLMIPVPIGYKNVLDIAYGDWRTPVIGKSKHSGVIFDPDNSYIIYQKEHNVLG